MIPLYTPEEVRRMDERAIAGGTASLALMERAAGHVARGVLALAGRAYGLRVTLLCGKGNNGGDGLAAARKLAAAGAAPTVWLTAAGAAPTVWLTAADGLSADTTEQLARWRHAGGRVEADLTRALRDADVIVDCLLGTGSAGAPRGVVADAIKAANDHGGPVVACDLPSGVDAATGQVPGEAVRATLTVTLGAEKAGLRLWPARGYCGALALADIGVAGHGGAPVAHVVEDADAAALLADPGPEADKRSRGGVLVVAGSPGMRGAAVLAARGALAAGAGLVTVAASAEVAGTVAAADPALIGLALPADPAARLEVLAERMAQADAVVAGPGLGLAAETQELVAELVRTCPAPLVLDADGLNAFRGEGERLASHAAPLLVCTPHRRELARVAGEDRWPQRLAWVPELAGRWNAVVVAKGPGTLVAGPDGRAWVNDTGSPALAVGGTGDVLAGMLGALLAQRPAAGTVAVGVHLHGRAGEVAAERRTARAAGPADVVEAVPEALRRVRGVSAQDGSAVRGVLAHDGSAARGAAGDRPEERR